MAIYDAQDQQCSRQCAACEVELGEAVHQVTVVPSWQRCNVYLCSSCWQRMLSMARRVARRQET